MSLSGFSLNFNSFLQRHFLRVLLHITPIALSFASLDLSLFRNTLVRYPHDDVWMGLKDIIFLLFLIFFFIISLHCGQTYVHSFAFFSIRFYSFVYFYIIWSIDKLLFYCRFAHQHTIVFIGFPSTERRRSSHVLTGRTNGSWTVRHGAWKSAFDYLHGRDRLHRLVARRRQRRKFRLRSAADDDGVAEPARRVWAGEEHQGADGDESHRHSRPSTAQTGAHRQKDRIPEPEWGGMVVLPLRAAAVDRLDRSVWAFVSLAMMMMMMGGWWFFCSLDWKRTHFTMTLLSSCAWLSFSFSFF